MLKEIGGRTVALVGITNDDASTLTFPGRMGTLVTQGSIAAANAARAAAVTAGADVVIALVHLGATGTNGSGQPTGPLIDFATGVTGFAAIVGDHTDIQVNTVINEAIVIENRSKGRTYARIDLDFTPGTNTVATRAATFVTPLQCVSADTPARCLPPDAAVDALLAPFRVQLAEQLDRKIGTATALFERGSNVERLGEVAIGDLVADSMRNACNSQVALTNGGGVRDKLPAAGHAPTASNINRAAAPFDLVVGDAHAILPFGNFVVCRTVTGAQLKAAMENGVAALPAANGRFAQISGFKVVYDLTREARDVTDGTPAGSRIVSMKLDNGTAIAAGDMLMFATSDFVNLGGDAYAMLNDGQGQNLVLAADALVAEIERRATLTPTTDGRIVDFAQLPRGPTFTSSTLSLAARAAAGVNVSFRAHSGVLQLNLPAPAGADGQAVSLASNVATVTVPANVTIAAGQSAVTFRVRTASTLATTATITATVGADQATATVNVLTTAATPTAGVGDIAITEVLADVPGSSGQLIGDYNCDGVRGGTEDEFFELKNVSSRAVALTGVGVWDKQAFDNTTTPRARFGTYILGPGEMVAVFSGGDPPGDDTLAAGPWCDSLLECDGDVAALGALFALNDTGDTVTLTATADRTSTVLTSFVYLSTQDQSLVRDPAPLGAVTAYSAATGALVDRKASPSTNTDGSNQAQVP